MNVSGVGLLDADWRKISVILRLTFKPNNLETKKKLITIFSSWSISYATNVQSSEKSASMKNFRMDIVFGKLIMSCLDYM